MKQDFFEFFLPTTILDRGAAARAVAAGSIAGGLLAITSGISTVILLFKEESEHQRIIWFLGATIVFAAVTVGTWKRMLSASLLGLLLSVVLVGWELQHRQIAIAIILATPLVGGFLAAVRGIVAFKNLGSHTPPN
jgi:TctA family transporter